MIFGFLFVSFSVPNARKVLSGWRSLTPTRVQPEPKTGVPAFFGGWARITSKSIDRSRILATTACPAGACPVSGQRKARESRFGRTERALRSNLPTTAWSREEQTRTDPKPHSRTIGLGGLSFCDHPLLGQSLASRCYRSVVRTCRCRMRSRWYPNGAVRFLLPLACYVARVSR